MRESNRIDIFAPNKMTFGHRDALCKPPERIQAVERELGCPGLVGALQRRQPTDV